MKRVAVIGGGIAGLTAAVSLVDRGMEVTLFEATPRCGGQIDTVRWRGFVVERGAEGFVASSTALRALCRRVGLEARLLSQRARASLALRDGRLKRLAPGAAARLLGIQVPESDIGRGLLTLRGGLGALTTALSVAVERRARLKLESRVTRIEAGTSGHHVVWANGGVHQTDAILLALPQRASAQLLEPLVGPLAASGDPRLISLVTISLATPREAVTHDLEASGFVADAERMDGLRACTFTSSKFPEHAPEGWCLLRAFYRVDRSTVETTPAAWATRAWQALAPVLGLREPPVRHWVSRWNDAIPRHPADAGECRARLRERLRSYGSIDVAGAAFAAGGIDGAVRSALAAAERIASSANPGIGVRPLNGEEW